MNFNAASRCFMSAPEKLNRLALTRNPQILSLLLLASIVFSASQQAKAQYSGCTLISNPPPVYAYCPGDPTLSSVGGSGDIPGTPLGGDPVNIGTGNVYLHITDYTTAGQNPLEFIRYYNSIVPLLGVTVGTKAYPTGALALGAPLSGVPLNWHSNYDRYLHISPSSSPTQVIAERADGQELTFTGSGSSWTTESDVDYTLTHTGSGSGSTWTLTDHNDTAEAYTDNGGGEGLLQTITLRNGYKQTLNYTSGKLASVSDSYGRSITLSYSGLLLISVSTPDSLVLTYGYTGFGSNTLLTSVSYNTSPTTSQTYAYGNSSFPQAITSITDENGNTSASWTYDGDGRALSSQNGGSLAANLTTFANSGDYVVTVINALGVEDVYNFTALQGNYKVTEIDRGATATTAAASEYFSYDSNGYLSSVTDWNGNVTNYTNDSHGDPTSIVEAYGSSPSVVRTTSITYDSTWVHEPDCITTTGDTLSFSNYDSYGHPQTITESDTASGGTACATSGSHTRTWATTWGTSSGNLGELLTITGPRSNLTQFAYTSGILTSITDPLSHVTTINTYTGGGYPTKITDPNSVVTNLAYDGRLNLHTRTLVTTAGNLVTTYAHDAANNLTQVTLPDSSYLSYGLDAANRLTTVTNALGETINYVLDALGDRTSSIIKNGSSTTTRKHTATFDYLGRMLTDLAYVTTSTYNTTTYAYDTNGNATSITDPRGHATGVTYDALNRPYQVTDRLSHTTTANYDAHNRITSIVDPKGNTTTYTRDGFGRVTQLASPDSGTSNYVYDLADNLTQKTDGASVVTSRTFDAINRELTRTFSSGYSSQDVYKTYDQTGFGDSIGHLTTMYDASGQQFNAAYDERGNEVWEDHIFGSTTFTVWKYYDNASRLVAVINPDTWAEGWIRDAAGQVKEVATEPSPYSTITPLVGSSSAYITHLPFGPALTLPFENGVTRTNTYDLDYKLTNMTDTGTSNVLNLSYGYDANGNVSCITDSLNAANSQIMTYDYMDRTLTAASGASSCAVGSGGGYGSYVWTWDANGNRVSETLNGGTTDTYSYNTGTDQVSSTSHSGYGISYNGAGETSAISLSGSPFSTAGYSQSEQQASVAFGGTTAASYSYDGFGQRLVKYAAVANLFFYGNSGDLTEETNPNPQTTDYIYLDPSSPRDAYYPVGMIGTPGIGSASYGIYFVHGDRLGTPQKVTDTSQAVQWSTLYNPFGATGTITNPNSITQNLRFPGMYADPETGLYHNGAREYTPTTGLYFQTDPTGLLGGTATYQYANANPFRFTDIHGLDPISWSGPGIGSTSGSCGLFICPTFNAPSDDGGGNSAGEGGGNTNCDPTTGQPCGYTPPGADPNLCAEYQCQCATPECAAGLPGAPDLTSLDSNNGGPLLNSEQLTCEIGGTVLCKGFLLIPNPYLKGGLFTICEVGTTFGCIPLFADKPKQPHSNISPTP